MSQRIRIRKRGKTYSYNFDIQKHPRRMKEKGGFATREEAEEAGIIAYAEWKHGNISIISERVKLRDYLDAWLVAVKPTIKKGTFASYSGTIKNRITPYLGDIILQELRPRDIDAWLRKLVTQNLAYSTIATTKTVLSNALKYAIYPAELITSNPVTGLRIPRTAPKHVVKRKIITREMFDTIPTDDINYAAYKLMYHTGMRIGEALGLAWSDIDFAEQRITISRQRALTRFDTPKTESSIRSFYVDDDLIAYLRTLKTKQAKEALALGAAYFLCYMDEEMNMCVYPKKFNAPKTWKLCPLICVRKNGKPYPRYSVINYLKKKYGMNSHSFRHTHATRLIEAGAKPIDVASRLGHSNASITLDIYTHDTDKMKRETARLFAKINSK